MVAGDGVNQALLVDDDEATDWAVLGAQAVPVAGKGVTVDLAGDVQQVRRVQVSALLRPANPADPGGDTLAQNRFTALRQFRVLACTASASTDCTAAADFRTVWTSPADAFPATRPRPVAPSLTLRSFEIPQTTATHLRLRGGQLPVHRQPAVRRPAVRRPERPDRLHHQCSGLRPGPGGRVPGLREPLTSPRSRASGPAGVG